MTSKPINLEERVGFTFSGTVEWAQLIGKWNWYDFTLIKVYAQNDKIFGQIELELGLLGFCANIVYRYKVTEQVRSMNEQLASLLKEEEGAQ